VNARVFKFHRRFELFRSIEFDFFSRKDAKSAKKTLNLFFTPSPLWGEGWGEGIIGKEIASIYLRIKSFPWRSWRLGGTKKLWNKEQNQPALFGI